MHRKLYLAAYDVREPNRLPRALRVVKGFASGGQKSAYECWLYSSERSELQAHIASVLDLTEDSFAVIPLEPKKPLITLGVAEKPADPDLFYFG